MLVSTVDLERYVIDTTFHFKLKSFIVIFKQSKILKSIGKLDWKLFWKNKQIRGFHKVSTSQEHCQLCFSCVIRKELHQWSLQPLNVILLYPLILNFIS